MSSLSYQNLVNKLIQYKKKYYENLLIRGCIVSLSLLLTAFLFVNILEHFGRFNPILRGFLFFSFIGLFLFSFIYWIINPILKLYNINKPISDEAAAIQIGKYFPEISDKLLNTVQLHSLSSSENELLQASIAQKTQQLNVVNFRDAIHFKDNNKYVKYVALPFLIILSLFIFSPQFLTESSARIVNFNKAYVPAAPFSFILKNTSLDVFKNEDFTLFINLEGKAIPDAAFINFNGRHYKMTSLTNSSFSYTFSKIQKDIDFSFEAAGFNSNAFSLNLITRPSLTQFKAHVSYPAYLNRENDNFNNVGNLVVPEGTQITWNFSAVEADSLLVSFDSDTNFTPASRRKSNIFEFSKQAFNSSSYQVKLKNDFSTSKEEIKYYLEVIPDQYPKINVEYFRDTTLYNYIVLGGNIADDYGLSKLTLHYKLINSDNSSNTTFRSIPISIQPKQAIQNFYYQWELDTLKLSPGEKIEYFVQVWDNDGVNGSKSTRSSHFTFQLPTQSELEKNLDQVSNQTKGSMNSALNKVDKLKKEINSLEDRLKAKKNLDFQDKKIIEDLLNKKQELVKEVESLQKQVSELSQKRDRFSENSPQLNEKVEQLQKLMDQLLDDETKKLYDELKKLLETNRNNAPDLLEKIDKKESNLEKEIARALEMFKQIQFDQKLEKDINKLKELAEKQKELSEQALDKKENTQPKEDVTKPENKDNTQENKDKTNKESQDKLEKSDKRDKNGDIQNKQQDLNQKFEETQKSLEELKELNKSMEEPNQMENTSEEEKNISEEQQKSLEQLQNNQNKKASQSQKNASQEMQEMADKLSQMQSEMEMEQTQENLDHLRDILENLITLSFDQEKLMKDFRNVNLSDPRFVKLSQEQLKLKDDAKIIEDSLYSLAKRVFQIESFVTREVSSMKEYMDESSEGIKERRLNLATGNQQLAMTSMNNLALLLNDVLKQLQDQMASMSKSGQKKKGNKKSPGLSELQQQLNNKIQQLQQSGKSGKSLSEELGRLAAEQEMLRNALQEMQKGRAKDKSKKGNDGDKEGSLGDLIKKMEETEKELVNKNLNNQTLNRQRDILTRLLDSEKAQKERDEEERREAEKAKDKPRTPPSQFEDYIKTKEKQIELLKTVPPALSPYYRKEVDKYFKKID